MQNPLYGVLKVVGIAVIVLMAGAIIYAMSTSVAYWSGIGV
jgi:hypothetical protein